MFWVGLAVQMPLPQIGSTIAIVFGRLISSIGAGAMVVSHAKDSYFWVIAQFSCDGTGNLPELYGSCLFARYYRAIFCSAGVLPVL